ncbi:MAG: hypothetical protein PHV36_13155 [Elusimicrobiales bacterium]|nr:hypothetical protein [Elusimicrobiales bacterium]
MPFELALYLSIFTSWLLSLGFLWLFLRRRLEEESSPAAALLLPLAIGVLAVAAALLLPPRSGYDNEHDLSLICAGFFPPDLRMIFSFKEVSPLFTDLASNLLSGYSLNALLWKNRLLQAASVLLFFSGLRRLGAGLAVSFFSCVFFAFNFLALLNANTFSSTPANVFIWFLSLLALAEAFRAEELKPRHVLWLGCSLVLTAFARYEFVPVNLLFLLGILTGREYSGRKEWRSPPNLGLFVFFTVLLVVWGFKLHSIDTSPRSLLGGVFTPLANFLYQLGERGFGVVAGHGKALAAGFTAFFGLLGLAGALLAGERRRAAILFMAALAVWAAYFSSIYKPADEYPLHLMRHQLYFLIPFVFLFASGLAGLEKLWAALGFNKYVFAALCGIFICAYVFLNVRAAVGLNTELRSNDRELAFLAAAKKAWPEDGELILYPCGDPMSSLLKGYFPVYDAASSAAGNELYIYAPLRNQVFNETVGDPEYCRAAPAAGDYAPWLESSFPHSFYTGWADIETRKSVPVKIGFYAAGTSERSLELNARASDLLKKGRPHDAQLMLRETLDKYPYCGLCRANLASALLLSGNREGAREELLKTIRFFPSLSNGQYVKAFLLACDGKDEEADAELEKIAGGAGSPRFTELAATLRKGLAAKSRGKN